MMHGRILRTLVLCLAIGAVSLQAAPLIYSTGVSNPHLLGAGQNDGHYSLVVLPGVHPSSLPSDLSGYTEQATYARPWDFAGWYTGFNGEAEWITPVASYGSTLSDPAGTYIFRTTIDLTGYDLSTVAVNGIWVSDNCGYDIRVNGFSTGAWGMTAPTCISTPHAFTLDSTSVLTATGPGGQPAGSTVNPWVAGTNVIEFISYNQPCPTCVYNPAGMAVWITSTQGTEVPEPAAFGLAGIALAGLAWWRKARQRAA